MEVGGRSIYRKVYKGMNREVEYQVPDQPSRMKKGLV